MSVLRVGGPWLLIVFAFAAADHGDAARPLSDSGPAMHAMPLDLLSNETDVNGLLLNPHWRQPFPDVGALCDVHGDPTLTHCTSQTVTLNFSNNTLVNAGCNMPTDLNLSFGGHMAGHKNWFPVTMTGSVELDRGYQEGGAGIVGWDADMDFLLRPSNTGALTKSSVDDKGSQIELEWDGYEVFYWQADPNSWWNRFFANKNNDSAKVMVNPDHPREPNGRDDNVIIGLLGLDCRHWCHTELHPVYAMALHTKADESADHWAVMARNSGNEGSCGSTVIETPMQTMSMFLPHANAQSREIVSSDISGHAGRYDDGALPLFPPAVGWWISDVVNPGTPKAGVLVTFVLPPPATRATIFGDFTLRWTQSAAPCRDCTISVKGVQHADLRSHDTTSGSARPRDLNLRTQNPNSAGSSVTAAGRVLQPRALGGDDDEHLTVMVQKMTPAQRKRFDASVPGASSIRTVASVAAGTKPSPAIPPDSNVKGAKVGDFTKIRYVPDPKREQAREQIIRAMCRAYGGQVPNFPSFCSKQ